MLDALRQGTVKEYVTSGKYTVKSMLDEMTTRECIDALKQVFDVRTLNRFNAFKTTVNDTVIHSCQQGNESAYSTTRTK